MQRQLKSLFSFILIISGFAASAQKATVTGKVTGEQSNLLSGVYVYLSGNKSVYSTTTDADGVYSLKIPSDTSVKIIFSLTGFLRDSFIVRVKANETKTVNRSLEKKHYVLGSAIITGAESKEKGLTSIDPRLYNVVTGPNPDVSSLIKLMMGVSTNSELSSQDSVRGGNYDENLVYVNDVEIYRPFLTRSGQQEGLSFPNPSMIENLKFSPGGFEAKYGDKMSSVLDIRYKRPKEFGGSAAASILGGNLSLEGCTKDLRLSGMIGARYQTIQYLLNSLDVQGEYRPAFTDIQGYLSYSLTDKWEIEFLGNYAVNNYRVFPENQRTEFGTINEALQLRVFFDGKDQSRFATTMGAITSTWRPNNSLILKIITSAFNSSETETSDVQGQYFIDELERDLGSDNFGDVAFNRGVGAYQTFIRNELNYQVRNIEHKGFYSKKDHFFSWGARAQYERINDRIKEWNMVDSADYSLPLFPDDAIILDSYLKSSASLESMRYHVYGQDNYHWSKDSTIDFSITGGVRANHWTVNGQTLVSPRVVFSMSPKNWTNIRSLRRQAARRDTLKNGNVKQDILTRDVTFRFAAGHYAQPPFYRELRGFDGTLNPNVKAQESWHFIAGTEFTFKSWGRDFSLTAEAYYKILKNLVPYEVDNVRIRYYADNLSDGYAAGIDMKVNGELVKGVQSWANISLMQTQEDIRNDFYYNYFNSDGKKIINGLTNNAMPVDSERVEPGYIPRPSDQRFKFSLFFQDYLPKNENLSMQITLTYGSRLPLGPPDFTRYKDTLRIPSYRRVDIGFTYHIISKEKVAKRDSIRKAQSVKWDPSIKTVKASRKETGYFKSLTLTLEVFNLLGVNNTVSYIWIKDVTNRTYAIPNYLTNRLINLKLQATF